LERATTEPKKAGEIKMAEKSLKTIILTKTARLTNVTAFVAALTAGLVPLPVRADDKPINLKISLWVPPSHPLVASAKEWAASITKESGGSITATIFPAEQLGKAFDHYDMVRDGIADIAYVSPGYQPGRFPIVDAAQLPFTVANGKSGSAAVDVWYAKYAAKEMGDTHYCMSFVSDPGTIHSKTKVVTPQDMKGHKVRPAQAMMGSFVTSLGATNVQASIAEARDIIDRGVADSITDFWNSQFLFGINNVTKFHIDVPMYVSIYVWPINKGVYDGASAAQKTVLDHHCTPEWAEKLASPWADFEGAGRDLTRKAPGHTVVELTPEQLAAWKQAALPLEKSWADAVRQRGEDPDKVLAELKAELTARNAAP
jgi:TRAP-type C4-dicarboxylate transport system substrate-binding protein